MYVAAAELVSKPGKRPLAGHYHASLEPHLHRIPGFIQETRYASVDVPNKSLILSWWESPAAISRWRNQSNHLSIQETSSKDVFQDYRLRIGLAYDTDQSVTETVLQPRCFVVLYTRQKRNGPTSDIDRMTELRDEAVSRVKAVMLGDATYENEASVLRLSVWRSQEDALLYEDSVVRVDGDALERVCVEREYTKAQRQDAPSHEPGKPEPSDDARDWR